MLNKVTMTGADDSVLVINDLVNLSKRFPFVEWGILVSRSQRGNQRFPSTEWIKELFYAQETAKMNLSCHLCGAYVRELLVGNVHKDLDELLNLPFQRVQINTHGQKHTLNKFYFLQQLTKYQCKEWIFQHDNKNTNILNTPWPTRFKQQFTFLFDLSHGAGISPEAWPNPIEGVYCGYAGGIGPDNIEVEIKEVYEVARFMVGDKEDSVPFWIDMETKIRSDDDSRFDLSKVEQCLQIASKYIQKEGA